MEILELSPKELVYMASILGAREFFGLKDPFYGMSHDEISAAISAMQTSLCARGFIEMDFTGSILIPEKIKSIVNDCTYCDAYALGEYQQKNSVELFTVYFKGEKIILLRSSGEMINLRVCNIEDVLSTISELVEHGKFGEKDNIQEEQCTFSYDVLNEARQLALHKNQDAARETMLQSGLRGNIAEVFLNSFTNNSRRSAFVVTNFVENSVDSILCITDSANMICIEKAHESNQEHDWIAFETTNKKYLDGIKALLNKVRCSLC